MIQRTVLGFGDKHVCVEQESRTRETELPV